MAKPTLQRTQIEAITTTLDEEFPSTGRPVLRELIAQTLEDIRQKTERITDIFKTADSVHVLDAIRRRLKRAPV